MYQLLLRNVLSTCANNNPQVAIAAVISAAGCIAVQTMESNAARAYLSIAFTDMLGQLGSAYENKVKAAEENPGETGQDADQSLA